MQLSPPKARLSIKLRILRNQHIILVLTIIWSFKSFSIRTSRTQELSLFAWLIFRCGSLVMRATHGLSLCRIKSSTTTSSLMTVLSSSRTPKLSTIQLTLDEIGILLLLQRPIPSGHRSYTSILIPTSWFGLATRTAVAFHRTVARRLNSVETTAGDGCSLRVTFEIALLQRIRRSMQTLKWNYLRKLPWKIRESEAFHQLTYVGACWRQFLPEQEEAFQCSCWIRQVLRVSNSCGGKYSSFFWES